jgi:hypothetical protein
MSPTRSVWLLNELERLGFTDDAFGVLHHFEKDTIQAHRSYCARVETFQPDGTNERVQLRLGKR